MEDLCKTNEIYATKIKIYAKNKDLCKKYIRFMQNK